MEAPDYDAVLDTLERLLPLYRFVESADGQRGGGEEAWTEPPLRLRPPSPRRWTEATLVERTIDVDLRHRALQDRLCRELVEEHGEGCVGVEHPAPGGGMIDVIVRTGAEQVLFEIKTAATARGCIREALGGAHPISTGHPAQREGLGGNLGVRPCRSPSSASRSSPAGSAGGGIPPRKRSGWSRRRPGPA